ncbi:hypothetical protein DTO271G3_1475 [Paecilomyces variotii]|nr:hypothetical protein DTO271G3_1475 [Paecilomyces variotii]
MQIWNLLAWTSTIISADAEATPRIRMELIQNGHLNGKNYAPTTNGTAIHNRAKRIMQAEGREDKLYACRLVQSRETAWFVVAHMTLDSSV